MSPFPQFLITVQPITTWSLPPSPLLFLLGFPIISQSLLCLITPADGHYCPSLTSQNPAPCPWMSPLSPHQQLSVGFFFLFYWVFLLYSILHPGGRGGEGRRRGEGSTLGFLTSLTWVMLPTPNTSTFLTVLRTVKYTSNHYRKFSILTTAC